MIITFPYQFSISEVGEWKIKGVFENLETNSIEIEIIGPNLRSTETSGEHLFFKSSDNKFLETKE